MILLVKLLIALWFHIEQLLWLFELYTFFITFNTFQIHEHLFHVNFLLLIYNPFDVPFLLLIRNHFDFLFLAICSVCFILFLVLFLKFYFQPTSTNSLFLALLLDGHQTFFLIHFIFVSSFFHTSAVFLSSLLVLLLHELIVLFWFPFCLHILCTKML